MKYGSDVKGNDNRDDLWRVEDYLDDASSKIGRAMEAAEAAGFDAVSEDLTELEAAIDEIRGNIGDAMSWIENGAEEDEAEEEEAGAP